MRFTRPPIERPEQKIPEYPSFLLRVVNDRVNTKDAEKAEKIGARVGGLLTNFGFPT